MNLSTPPELASRLPASIKVDDLAPPLRIALSAIMQGRDAIIVASPGTPRDPYLKLGAWIVGSAVLAISPESGRIQEAPGLFTPWAAGGGVDIADLADAEEGAEPAMWPGSRTMPEPDGEVVAASPEEIHDSDFREALKELSLRLVLIDAAERVSAHSGEKLAVYGTLAKLVESLGRPPVIAFISESSPEILEDVRTLFKLQDPVVTYDDILRPNIHYDVLRTVNAEEKRRTVEGAMRQISGPGLIHTGTVNEARLLVDHFADQGIKAILWHSKMKKAEREEVEAAFRTGEVRVITSVAGSRVPADRPDIRFVIHMSPPNSLESYVFETGRLSRDGRPGHALLLYDASDQKSQRLAAGSHFPTQDEFERVYDACEELSQEEREIPVKDINALSGVSYARAKTIVSILKRAGYLKQAKTSSKYILLQPKKTHEQLMTDLAPFQSDEEKGLVRRQGIIRYTRSTRCRAQFLAAHMGVTLSTACGVCDVCREAAGETRAVDVQVAGDVAPAIVAPRPTHAEVVVSAPEDDLPPPPAIQQGRFGVGDVVFHPAWGDGEVMDVHDGKLLVDFPSTGEKKLSEKLLTPGDRSRMPKRAPKAEKPARASRAKSAKKTPAVAAAPAPADEAVTATATIDEPPAPESSEESPADPES